MSLRQLVEGDCGGVNPLMQLGGQFTRDAAHKDEGYVQAQFERSMRQDEQMVNEFLGQVAGPPQSFQMETLLQEMREIEQAQMGPSQLQHAPRVIDEVAGQWSKEFGAPMQIQPPAAPHMVHVQPQQQQMTHVREFFDEGPETSSAYLNRPAPYLAICPPHPSAMMDQQMSTGLTDKFFEEASAIEKSEQQLPEALQGEDWVNDYQTSNESNEQAAANYNEKFWQRLQDEWAKLSEESDHPWLSEYDENYDPYKEYKFAEENPMQDIENALEKGKEYLAKGDIPSAVLCFEAAASKDPENAEAWELLGISQAENEMDPQGIAALKRSLDLRPDNLKVLMALAVCYTNESLQSQAVKMLTNWLQLHPKYKHLVPAQPETPADAAASMASSLIRGNKLQEVQNMYLEAVRMNPQTVDPEVQEALGVLYNLSSEYDKAVDCFQAALHANPQNAKVWNRLGASLANGSRSVEAVEAYQRALELEPGFIRVRYNVGVCCLNLKAYQQAVEHLLTALNMQANVAASRELPAGSVGAGQQQMSESIWSTLKMVISLMGRNDLQGFVSDRNLSALNEAFKD
ncbi:peroxisomal targeting signal 1 receptor [Lucilia sericata]|uniref:peroxisomal targeting signal 1 receptor n=1 Tax=Lucilia sericata TaxID=13632 RepID=UPI0018A85D2C|nr:peroxisomal targeting signal 1 receptor [Lucilia sericata]